jgi:hypothetical protein
VFLRHMEDTEDCIDDLNYEIFKLCLL